MFDIFDPSTWGMDWGGTGDAVGNAVEGAGSVGTTLSPGGAGTADWWGNVGGSDFGLGTSLSDAGGGILDSLKNLPSGVQNIVKSLLGSGVPTSSLGGILKSLGLDPNGILGQGLSLAAREAPGLMALNYANTAGNPMQGILDQLSGNQNAVIKAATDPLQANIAAGYGDLVQSQGVRGIRGSSFGDTDIANYLSRTGTALGNAGANAAEGSLALQGQLTQQAQTAKNNLFGKAFDILGRGLTPQGFGNTLSLAGP